MGTQLGGRGLCVLVGGLRFFPTGSTSSFHVEMPEAVCEGQGPIVPLLQRWTSPPRPWRCTAGQTALGPMESGARDLRGIWSSC